MKAIRFLLLALGASSASACSQYSHCHCMNSDGNPNDAATKAVCNGEGAGIGSIEPYKSGSDSYTDCVAQHGCWNNCSWRKDCYNAGATGSDSHCRVKCNPV